MSSFANPISMMTAGMLLAANLPAQQKQQLDPRLAAIDIEEQLGEHVPMDLKFQNSLGESVTLGSYFQDEKPVIVVLAYYRCEMLCSFVLNGLSNGMKELAWKPGNEYKVLTISFDPSDSAEIAAAKQKNYVESLGKGDVSESWQFWTSPDESQVQKLADAFGFKYAYDEKINEYGHPATLHMLTSEGKISRYLYGFDYREKDLRLALMDASEGKVGSMVDRFIWRCYHYDPQGKKYALAASNVMRIGGVLTVVAILILLAAMRSFERRRQQFADSALSPEQQEFAH
jgi:protein SCO1/2